MTAALCLLALLPAQERTVVFGRAMYPNEALPRFDKGYLLFVNRNGNIEVWNPQGQLAFSRSSHPAGSRPLSASVDDKGSLAVGVAYQRADGTVGGGIQFFDPKGNPSGWFETGRYIPSHIAVEGSEVWAFGWQRDGTARGTEDRSNYKMFRKYSRDGRELLAIGDRSDFPIAGLSPGGARGGLWRIHVSGGWMRALAFSGQTSDIETLIQFKTGGSNYAKWTIGPDAGQGRGSVDGIGLCRRSASKIECFDTASATWKADERFPAIEHLLLGAEGNTLVAAETRGNIVLHYYPAAKN